MEDINVILRRMKLSASKCPLSLHSVNLYKTTLTTDLLMDAVAILLFLNPELIDD